MFFKLGKDKPKDDFEKDDDDDDEDDGTAKAATEPTTTTLPIQTPPPAHDRVYGYYSDEGLEKKASELKVRLEKSLRAWFLHGCWTGCDGRGKQGVLRPSGCEGLLFLVSFFFFLSPT